MNEDPRSLDSAPGTSGSPLGASPADEGKMSAEANPLPGSADDASSAPATVVVTSASAEGESASLPAVDPKAETAEWAPAAEQPPLEAEPSADRPAAAEPGPSADASSPGVPESSHPEVLASPEVEASASESSAPAPAPASEVPVPSAAEPVAEVSASESPAPATEPAAEAPPAVAAVVDTPAEPPPAPLRASGPSTTEEASSAPAPAPEKPAKKRRSAKAAKAADEHAPVAVADAPASSALAAEPATSAAPAAPATEAPAESKKKWYVIKVASNREEAIKAAIERRVKIEGLEEYFGQIVIPVERVTQVKKVTEKRKDTGEKVTKEKRVVKEHKKYPGYLFAEVEFNDRILYLFRETSGVGDFVGASLNRVPTPMTEKEVQAMLHGVIDAKDKGKGAKTIVKLDYEKGDKVRIREGAFANSEGEVKFITEPKDPGDTPKVTVVVTIWGRPVDVELDYWQVDKV